jgi:hypothetical protein
MTMPPEPEQPSDDTTPSSTGLLPLGLLERRRS